MRTQTFHIGDERPWSRSTCTPQRFQSEVWFLHLAGKKTPQNCRATLGFTIKDLYSQWISSYSHAPSVSLVHKSSLSLCWESASSFLHFFFFFNQLVVYEVLQPWFPRLRIKWYTYLRSTSAAQNSSKCKQQNWRKGSADQKKGKEQKNWQRLKPFIHTFLVKNLCEMSVLGRFGSSEMPSKARQYVNWAQYTCQMCQTVVFNCIQCHSEHDHDHPRPSAKFWPHSPT